MSGTATHGFLWYDYVIFAITLVISLGIGLYFALAGAGQKTTKQYLMGNRNLGVVPVALSMFMSYISAILVLGNAAEMYQHGVMFWMACVGSSAAFTASAIIFVPLFFPLKITSAFEYLEMRFKSKCVRLSGATLIIIVQVLYMGIAMYSPATALEAATGFPTWASILLTGVIATVYTSIGGMKAVIWTDVFQAVIYIGGIFVVLVAGSIQLGGITRVWDICMDTGRLTTWHFESSPLMRMNIWSLLIGRFLASMNMSGTGQTSVQRYCALPTLSGAKWSVLLNIPLFLVVQTLTCAVGLVVFAHYHERGCDPLRSGEIKNSNQLLPYYIVDGLKIPALPGLFVAVLFSGALSTLSSSMNSMAAVTWKDFLEWKFYNIAEERKALITKILVAIFGAVAIGMAFLSERFGGHVMQAAVGIVGGAAGPLLGIYMLGAFFPCGNWMGAVAGAWIGLAVSMTCTIGSHIHRPYRETLNTTVALCSQYGFNTTISLPTDPPDVHPLFRLSFLWFPAVGTVVTVVVGLLISLLTKHVAGPDSITDTDPRLVIPLADRLLCCLPASWRRALSCGITFDKIKYNDDGTYVMNQEDTQEEPGSLTKPVKPEEEQIGYLHTTSLKARLNTGQGHSGPPSYCYVNASYQNENTINTNL